MTILYPTQDFLAQPSSTLVFLLYPILWFSFTQPKSSLNPSLHSTQVYTCGSPLPNPSLHSTQDFLTQPKSTLNPSLHLWFSFTQVKSTLVVLLYPSQVYTCSPPNPTLVIPTQVYTCSSPKPTLVILLYPIQVYTCDYLFPPKSIIKGVSQAAISFIYMW